MKSFNQQIEICEVGPRDGLQNLKRPFSVAEKVELINKLSDFGIPRIEAGSFVNVKKVPNMGDFESVLDMIKRKEKVTIAGLALNEKGVQRALSHGGVDEVRYVIVASNTFSKINQGTSVQQTLQMLENVASNVLKQKKKLSVVVAAAFGCPYEGEIPKLKVFDLLKRSLEFGADEIIVADTIGAGFPAQVEDFCNMIKSIIGDKLFGFHFHNTRNLGYANALAAINGGAHILDSSVGGLGGCPFVPKATGNIATEDLLYLLKKYRKAANLDSSELLEIVGWLTKLIPESITGQLYEAGFFPENIKKL